MAREDIEKACLPNTENFNVEKLREIAKPRNEEAKRLAEERKIKRQRKEVRNDRLSIS